MKLKYVSGMKIRNTIDADFGVIGSNKIYSYIPKNEIWFDRLYKEEKEHFLKIHLYELKLIKEMRYEKARKIIEKRFIVKGKIPDFVVKKTKYKGFSVVYVDGRIIREYLDPKFILGCNGILNKKIWKNKILNKKIWKRDIWIDIRQDKREYKYTLIHEYEEAKLIMQGMNYNDAHDYAIAAEKAARRKDGARYLKD